MPTTSINIEINIQHRRKDGGIPVQFRLRHRGETLRIASDIIAYPEEFSRSKKLKAGRTKDKAEDLLRRMRNALSEISYFDLQQADVKAVAKLINAKMTELEWSLDFFVWGDSYLQATKMAKSTKATFRNALAALKRFVGLDKLDINSITVAFLQDFCAFLANEPRQHYDRRTKTTSDTKDKTMKHAGTVDRLYLSKIASLYKKAQNRYNDEDLGIIRIPRHPFNKVSIAEAPSHGQKALSLATVRLLTKAETDNPALRRALDIAIVSLCSCGANMADLYRATPPVDGIFEYERIKTTRRRKDGARMRIRIPAAAAPYIYRLQKGAKPGTWLNLSHYYTNADNATRAVNKQLKAWAVANGLPEFTFYAIRKAWATIAHSEACGVIDKAVIDECLVHVGDHKIADIYIEKDWNVIWNANDKVMSVIFQNE